MELNEKEGLEELLIASLILRSSLHDAEAISMASKLIQSSSMKSVFQNREHTLDVFNVPLGFLIGVARSRLRVLNEYRDAFSLFLSLHSVAIFARVALKN